MNNHSVSGTTPENPACQQWGLKSTIIPCFGARLVQEGNRLHFLADRAGFNGAFSDKDVLRPTKLFPDTQTTGNNAHQRRAQSPQSALRHALPQRIHLRSRYAW